MHIFDPERGFEASADQPPTDPLASARRSFYRWRLLADGSMDWEKVGSKELRSGLVPKVVKRDPSKKLAAHRSVPPADAPPMPSVQAKEPVTRLSLIDVIKSRFGRGLF